MKRYRQRNQCEFGGVTNYSHRLIALMRIHLSIEKISREFRREGKQGSREVRRVVVTHHNTRRARLDARSSSYTRGHSWSRALAFHAVASS